MESHLHLASRDDLWRLQETVSELTATQAQHNDRIMRLEKRREDELRGKNVWGPSMSPFPGGSFGNSTSHGEYAPIQSRLRAMLTLQESNLNPAAEAFRNFDAEPPPNLTSSFTLDDDERKRASASRANSVRFDESANNHYGSTPRQSIDLPTRTGSGLGSHPMSERSLSHRSDSRGPSFGVPHRTNSFGLESSRLLGSINNSPRISGNPPPGFFVLGPCPTIIRCWLTTEFLSNSILYAAVCSGSYASSIAFKLVQSLNLEDQIFDDNGVHKIKLPIHLVEAKICQASSRSASPAPQVPWLVVTFAVDEMSLFGKSIQIILGSDVLRGHNADVMFSTDRLMIFDDEKNQVAVPMVRPENDAVYKHLTTTVFDITSGPDLPTPAAQSTTDEQRTPGIIGRPARLITEQPQSSPINSPSVMTSAAPSEPGDIQKGEPVLEAPTRSSIDSGQPRPVDDEKSASGSEKSYNTPTTKTVAGVWGSSWRAGPSNYQQPESSISKTASGYSRANPPRNMKVLRPGKSMSSASRSTSSSVVPNGNENQPPRLSDVDRRTSTTSGGETKPPPSAPNKSNPVGSASAFGWLNSSGQKRAGVTNGE